MATIVLFGLIAFIVWVVSLYLWPFRKCRRCDGTGRNRGSNQKRFGECRCCKRTGQHRRIGAKTVHRGRVSLAERRRNRK